MYAAVLKERALGGMIPEDFLYDDMAA
jgi:hypothetical protein